MSLASDVGDQREGAQVVLEGLGERLRGGLARRSRSGPACRLSVGSIASDLLPTLKRRRRDGLVEQPVPGRIGRHRLLVEQLLDAVLELIGLVLADVFEPRPVVPERGILHGRFERGVVEPVELEHEEQEMRGGRRDPLLHVAVEFRAHGIDGVAGMNESGIGDRAGRADRRAAS